jgi:hypothetical protein
VVLEVVVKSGEEWCLRVKVLKSDGVEDYQAEFRAVPCRSEYPGYPAPSQQPEVIFLTVRV